ncbi:MAG: GAF domain-containing protein, partial [Burkholderiaceae bacterium]|nr:GAF domain-containing protein [Burkholderiaceae bacterium]
MRKCIVLGIGLALVWVWLLYGAFYVAAGAHRAAWVSFATAALQALLCALYLKTRSFPLLSRAINGLALLSLLAVHLALGGFGSSGYVLIYAMTPLFLSTALEDPRWVKAWMGATVGVMLLAGIGEGFVTPGSALSPSALTAFTVFNIVGFCSFVLVPSLVHGQRMQAIQRQLDEAHAAQLAQKAEHLAQTQAALQQQTATAELLQVISSSVADAQPVLEKILDSCTHLFDVNSASVMLIGEDESLHLSAHRSLWDEGRPVGMTDAEYAAARARMLATFPKPLAGTATAVAIASGRVLNFPDVLNGTDVPRAVRATALASGINYSTMMAPLMQGTRGLGAISLMRAALGGFSEREQALLKTFADQAVIAIQNAKMFRETQEALQRQTATAEVLQVIGKSVADAQPVFDRILDSCLRLFEPVFIGINLLRPDGRIDLAAFFGPREAEFRSLYPLHLDEHSGTALVIRQRDAVHFADAQTEAGVPDAVRRGSELMGSRSVVFAPLMWQEHGVGSIFVGRSDVAPFSAHEISLIKTFADQAVIAIQNATMFRETNEALEQQRASADVLGVISRSMGDASPVLDAILEKCEFLIDESVGSSISLLGEDGLVHRRHFRVNAAGRVWYDTPAQVDAVVQMLIAAPPTPLAGSLVEAVLRAGRAVVYPDVVHGTGAPEGMRKTAHLIVGNQESYALLAVPLLKDGRGLGTISVARARLGDFSAKEIALLQTFADQAVVAIENARLFNETQQALHAVEQRSGDLTEALDYQTAISDVLRVISESPTDVQPVFRVIMDSAARLFGTTIGAVFRYDGSQVHLMATSGWSHQVQESAGRFYPGPPNPTQISGRVLLSGQVQVITDTFADSAYDAQTSGKGGWRRMLGAP